MVKYGNREFKISRSLFIFKAGYRKDIIDEQGDIMKRYMTSVIEKEGEQYMFLYALNWTLQAKEIQSARQEIIFKKLLNCFLNAHRLKRLMETKPLSLLAG